MDPKSLFFSLFTSILILCSTGKYLNSIEHDFVNFPSTNPVSTSPPTIITIPSATPVTVTPTPAVTTNAPGQRWCVAKVGVPEKNLQAALDYACGIGKADCSGIQQGAGCYNPNTLQNHASFAFNSYYQRNPAPTSCDFGGTAVITTTNPSSGSCIFPTSSSSSSPTTASPITTPPIPTTPTPATPILTPTTASSSGAAPTGSSGIPPTILNGSNPGLGGVTTGFGDSPPGVNMTSSVSQSSSLIGSILVVASIVTGGMVM